MAQQDEKALVVSKPASLAQLDEQLAEAQVAVDVEVSRLTGDEQRLGMLCRWGLHITVTIDPSDAEHEELCRLLGRSRYNMSLASIKSILDRVCIRCGHIDPGLQRFLISLRKLRSLG